MNKNPAPNKKHTVENIRLFIARPFESYESPNVKVIRAPNRATLGPQGTWPSRSSNPRDSTYWAQLRGDSDHPSNAEAVGQHPETRGPKRLFKGMVTIPPLESSEKACLASASVGKESESENPEYLCPSSQPSEAISTHWPIRKLACITLPSNPGGSLPGGCGWGLSLYRITNSTTAPTEAL